MNEIASNKSTTKTVFQDTFAEEVWESTYKDHADDNIDETLSRVATFVASAETTPELQQKWQPLFNDMLSDFKCTSGGRIYSNAGTEWSGTTLMNCFVAPRRQHDIDSLSNILHNVHNQTQTLKSEGGWGENFSYIRPRGGFIFGIGVETPGAVKYMEMFDTSSDIITAGSGKTSTNKKAKGKIRKGAMMGVLDVWHPDIIEFITAKQQPGRLSKFNISVNCSDEFMTAVTAVKKLTKEKEAIEQSITNTITNTLTPLSKAELTAFKLKIKNLELDIAARDEWNLRFPDTQSNHYLTEWSGDMKLWEEKGYPVIVHNTVSVLWLWNLIMESTYNRAEPGVLFLDRANYYSPLNYKETIYATNPCGEQTLAPAGVCNLGSANLTQFINKARDGFDLERLAKYIRILVRFLDNINSLSNAPLEEYVDSMRKKRRIGCGILGWGSALYMLKVKFGSQQAGKLRDEVMSTIAREAYMASIDLAEEKGMFEYCDPQQHAQGVFVNSLDLPSEYMDKLSTTGIRNSSLISIQPTGNTSIFANISSGGLEPIFLHEYVRTVIVNSMPDNIADVTPKWFEGEWHETEAFKFDKEGDEEILKATIDDVVYKIDKNRGLTREVLCEDYGVRFMKSIGEWDPEADWAVTTDNLDVSAHVEDLKGFARWVDSAISKTVNVPNDYSFEDFQDIYLDAYDSGYVKGITTYRSGTMTTVLAATEEKELAPDYEEEVILEDVKMPSNSPATIKTLRAESKKWYLTTVLNEQQTRPMALFVHTNSPEATITTSDAVERLIQLAGDKGIPDVWIDETLSKIGACNNVTKIARAISLNLRHGVLIRNIVATLDDVDDVFVGSFLFQIRKFLSTYIKDGEVAENTDACPECGSHQMIYQEGCVVCASCGWSKC